jgi:uncharacterized protein (DUF1501 family)
MNVDRRAFLRKSICAALGGASLYSALGNLRLVAAATRNVSFSDYKALVCIYLYGGNDGFNTIVPYTAGLYAQYAASRRNLALAQADMQANALSATASDGGQYGTHPALGDQTASGGNAGMRALFNAGKMAIIANVGTLLYPLTSAQYRQGNVPVPPQLFSHADQTPQWQTARPDDPTALGWSGRVADLLYTANSGTLPMSVTLSNGNVWQRGAVVNQYALGTGDVDGMDYLGTGQESWVIGDNPDGATAYNALFASGTQAHVLERAYADTTRRAISNYTQVKQALYPTPALPPLATAFPDTELGNQLRRVAEMIRVRGTLGMSRQTFFVSVGNYDTHADQLLQQQGNLAELSQALNAFYNATVELGVANSVTAFTASDFGRSLPVNSTGTDHGWGGHHFVVGGAVHGGSFYGTMPSLALNTDANPNANPDDTGYGQIVPTTSVDQYAATLASWFGVGASDVATIFPNLGRFTTGNLGFV